MFTRSICLLALLLTACPDAADAPPLGEAADDARPTDATASPADAAADVGVDPSDTGPPDAAPPGDAAAIADAQPSTDGAAPDAGVWRSALYGPDWTPDHEDADGRFLHDFSYAGYRRGAPLPELDPADRAFPVPLVDGDATAAIQGAIAEAVAAGGGVVQLPEGDLRVDGRLTINTSGVHLRGAGSDLTRVQFSQVDGMGYTAYLTVGAPPTHGPDLPLAMDAVPRQHTLALADVSDLQVGADVLIGAIISPGFVEAHGMTGVWGPFNDTWQPFFRREVVAIDGDAVPPTVTLDVPIRYPLKVLDGASLRVETGLISEVSVSGFSVSTAVPYEAAWADAQVHAIAFMGVKDGWAQDIGTFAAPEGYANRRAPEAHLRSGGIIINASKRVTVADSHLAYPQNRGGGGNGYLFEIRQSNEILTRDSVGLAGRHNFIQNWGFGVSGCVWLRVHSSEGFALVDSDSSLGRGAPSEFHHSLAMANLIDQSRFDDGWASVNRGLFSSGAGHSATENVVWNATGDGNVLSFQYGHGYVIGTAPEIFVFSALPNVYGEGTTPEDWVEGAGEAETLRPRSLYEDQRRRRLEP